MSEETAVIEAVEQEEQLEAGWSIKDLGAADWSLARIADLEREVDENTAMANAQIAKLQHKAQALNAPLLRRVEFFRTMLAAYAQANRAAILGNGKKKSRALLHGVLAWRKIGGGLTVTDRDALLEWARAQPVELELVRVREEPAVAEIKRHCAATGEVPPGAEVVPEGEEFSVKATMGESHE
jgi:phage host-nuclease inhibitor protein Gam